MMLPGICGNFRIVNHSDHRIAVSSLQFQNAKSSEIFICHVTVRIDKVQFARNALARISGSSGFDCSCVQASGTSYLWISIWSGPSLSGSGGSSTLVCSCSRPKWMGMRSSVVPSSQRDDDDDESFSLKISVSVSLSFLSYTLDFILGGFFRWNSSAVRLRIKLFVLKYSRSIFILSVRSQLPFRCSIEITTNDMVYAAWIKI